MKRNHLLNHGGDPFAGLPPLLLVAQQVRGRLIATERQFGKDEGKYKAFRFIFLVLPTQHSILLLFKHIPDVFVSVLRAEPSTDRVCEKWSGLYVLDMQTFCSDSNWEERNTLGWHGTPPVPASLEV